MNNIYLTEYGIDVVRDNFKKNYLDYTEKAIENVSSDVQVRASFNNKFFDVNVDKQFNCLNVSD